MTAPLAVSPRLSIQPRFAPQAYLNGGYTIFGQVTSGMDVVLAIKLRDPDKSPTYPGDAMQTVTISEK